MTRVITELMKSGVIASINENIDFETAEIVGEYLGFKVKKTKEENVDQKKSNYSGSKKTIRPPVITIIGHVDHGKTTLLDYIRKTNVAGGESGGITQHIGSYQIERNKRKITFIDTPGHAAFSAMREHGVRITDVAVLVVVADDGGMPQTKESINFAREAGVPIVVAINKIDKTQANIEKTKKELGDMGLIPEDWGGKTVMGGISAKTGQGVDELLDLILLVADMKKLESYIDVPANGFIIESHLSGSRGAVATVLVRDGVLKVGDSFIIGKTTFGRIRSMTDYGGKRIKEAGPSVPARISGLSATPDFGDLLEVQSSLKEAKDKIAKCVREGSVKSIAKKNLATISSSIRSGELRELCLIIKADVAGSLKAIEDTINNMSFEEVKVKIISSGVGDITESDVKMASAADVLVIGFRVDITLGAKRLMETTGVSIEVFDVIYELIDKVTLALSGLLEAKEEIVETGDGKILKVFKDGKNDKILGVKMESGKCEKNSLVKIFRNKELFVEGRIISLRKVDKDVEEVSKGSECGMKVVFNKASDEKIRILEGDTVLICKKEMKIKKLTKQE